MAAMDQSAFTQLHFAGLPGLLLVEGLWGTFKERARIPHNVFDAMMSLASDTFTMRKLCTALWVLASKPQSFVKNPEYPLSDVPYVMTALLADTRTSGTLCQSELLGAVSPTGQLASNRLEPTKLGGIPAPACGLATLSTGVSYACSQSAV